MKTIHAVFENGIFRPTESVELPEGTPVVVTAGGEPVDGVKSARERVYRSLSRSYDGGSPDEAERHDEHHP